MWFILTLSLASQSALLSHNKEEWIEFPPLATTLATDLLQTLLTDRTRRLAIINCVEDLVTEYFSSDNPSTEADSPDWLVGGVVLLSSMMDTEAAHLVAQCIVLCPQLSDLIAERSSLGLVTDAPAAGHLQRANHELGQTALHPHVEELPETVDRNEQDRGKGDSSVA